LADVRITYSGLMDVVRRKQLILREVHVGKAHLTIVAAKQLSTSRAPSTADASTDQQSTAGESGEWPLNLLQIDRLTLADVVLTNPATGFSLAIPALEWTGFKAERGNVEFGQLSADTDRFTIATREAPASEFQKRIAGTLLPKLHPKIRRPIDFVADVGYAEGNVTCRVSAFEGKLDLEIKPDRTGSLHCTGLDLADYFDAPLPQKFKIEVVSTAAPGGESRPLELRGGSFKLGVRTFEIQPAKWGLPAGEVPASLLRAISREGAEEIWYELLADNGAEEIRPFRPRLTAKPALSPQDTLARVFYGKDFADLTPAEQEDIKKKQSSFQVPIINALANAASKNQGEDHHAVSRN
jgi:hypothetical protein